MQIQPSHEKCMQPQGKEIKGGSQEMMVMVRT